MQPEDGTSAAAAGRGHLRASHADRERAISTLKVAFVQGRLVKNEFELRVSRALASRTYAELAALTADLPAGLLNAQPPPEAVSATDHTRIPTALGVGAWVFVWLGLVSVVVSIAIQALPLASIGVCSILVASPLAGGLVLQTWRDRQRGKPA